MTQIHKSSDKRIEHLKLKEVNGFARIGRMLIKAIIIILISSLVGGLAGYTVQKSFRELTGYKISEPVTVEAKEAVGATAAFVKKDRTILGKIADATEALKDSIKNSEIVQKTNDAVSSSIADLFKPITDLLNSLLEAIDKAAFWVPFLLLFLITAWFSNKIITAKNYFTHGADPQVDKNMKLLEAKINELVDQANKGVIVEADEK